MAYAGHSRYQVNSEESPHPQVVTEPGWLVQALDHANSESRR
jgi:hypothetical protein